MVQYILKRLKGDKIIWMVIFLIAMISLLGVATVNFVAITYRRFF